jgi:hypothetical protein
MRDTQAYASWGILSSLTLDLIATLFSAPAGVESTKSDDPK